MPFLNMPVQRLKVAILPLHLPCSGRNTFRGNFNHWQVSWKEADRFYLNDDRDVKNVSRFEYWRAGTEKKNWTKF